MTKYRVEVLAYGEDADDDIIVKTLGPHEKRAAEQVERGLNRNLAHDSYWTRIVECEEKEQS